VKVLLEPADNFGSDLTEDRLAPPLAKVVKTNEWVSIANFSR